MEITCVLEVQRLVSIVILYSVLSRPYIYGTCNVNSINAQTKENDESQNQNTNRIVDNVACICFTHKQGKPVQNSLLGSV